MISIPAQVSVLTHDEPPRDSEPTDGRVEVEIGSFTTDGKPLDVVLSIEDDDQTMIARLTPFQVGRLSLAILDAVNERP